MACADGKHLACTLCQHEYLFKKEIPHILHSEASENHYRDGQIVNTYYEAHYGPYITETPNLQARLTFPLANLVDRAEGGAPIELAAALEWQRSERERQRIRSLRWNIAPFLDQRAMTESFYQCMLELCEPYVDTDAMVLDAGCGLGRMTAELARLGAKQVIGLDRSPPMVEAARRILGKRGSIPVTLNRVGAKHVAASLTLPWAPPKNLDFVVGDVTCLPLQSESFDLVTCINLLDRVLKPRQMVAELGRVLRPGGHLLITDPYDWDEEFTKSKDWVEDMTMLFAPTIWTRAREIDGVPFVLRYYSRRISIYMNHCVVLQKTAA